MSIELAPRGRDLLDSSCAGSVCLLPVGQIVGIAQLGMHLPEDPGGGVFSRQGAVLDESCQH